MSYCTIEEAWGNFEGGDAFEGGNTNQSSLSFDKNRRKRLHKSKMKNNNNKRRSKKKVIEGFTNPHENNVEKKHTTEVYSTNASMAKHRIPCGVDITLENGSAPIEVDAHSEVDDYMHIDEIGNNIPIPSVYENSHQIRNDDKMNATQNDTTATVFPQHTNDITPNDDSDYTNYRPTTHAFYLIQ